MQNNPIGSLWNIYAAPLKEVKNIEFTSREIDILSCILGGRSSKKIAPLLSISPKTVEAHTRNIMLKTGCRSQSDLIGFIETSDKFLVIRTHYLSLLIQEAFEKSLKEIALLKKHIPLACLVFYQGTSHTPLIHDLKVSLDKLEIEVKTRARNQSITSDFILQTFKYIKEDYLIALVSKEFSPTPGLEDHNNLEFFKLNQEPFLTRIILWRKKSSNKASSTFQRDKKLESLEYKNFYFFILGLIEKMLPEIDLTKISLEFKKHYTLLSDGNQNKRSHPSSQIPTILKDKYFSQIFLKRSILAFSLTILSLVSYFINIFEKEPLLKMTQKNQLMWNSKYEENVKKAISQAQFYQLRGNMLNTYQASRISKDVIDLGPLLDQDLSDMRGIHASLKNSWIFSPFNWHLRNDLVEEVKNQGLQLLIAQAFNKASKFMDEENFTSAMQELEENVLKRLKNELGRNTISENIKMIFNQWIALALNIKDGVAKRKLYEHKEIKKETYHAVLREIIKTLSGSLRSHDPSNFNTHLLLHYISIVLLRETKDLEKRDELNLKQKAEYHLAQSLLKAPKSGAAHGALALHYFHEKKYEKAIIAFNSALILEPDNAGILHNRAKMYLTMGEEQNNLEYYKKAYRDAQKANNIKPSDCDIIKLVVWSALYVEGCQEFKNLSKNLYKPLCVEERKEWDNVSAVRNESIEFLEEKFKKRCPKNIRASFSFK